MTCLFFLPLYQNVLKYHGRNHCYLALVMYFEEIANFQGNDLYCCQPSGGDLDVLALTLGSSHVILMNVNSLVSTSCKCRGLISHSTKGGSFKYQVTVSLKPGDMYVLVTLFLSVPCTIQYHLNLIAKKSVEWRLYTLSSVWTSTLALSECSCATLFIAYEDLLSCHVKPFPCGLKLIISK